MWRTTVVFGAQHFADFAIELSVSGHHVEHPGRNAGADVPVRQSPCADQRRQFSEAGRTTKLQPAAKAGAALRVIMAIGKFHGVMAAHTPMGWLAVTKTRLSASWGRG
jgi:hypothetical protein